MDVTISIWAVMAIALGFYCLGFIRGYSQK